MPIYEFSCLQCRHTFEVFGGYASRGEKQVCPQCEGTNTKALFSTFAVMNSRSEGSPAAASSPGAGCACSGGGCACAN